jgi:hypothetical protein
MYVFWVKREAQDSSCLLHSIVILVENNERQDAAKRQKPIKCMQQL